jgi:hypothetical protein
MKAKPRPVAPARLSREDSHALDRLTARYCAEEGAVLTSKVYDEAEIAATRRHLGRVLLGLAIEAALAHRGRLWHGRGRWKLELKHMDDDELNASSAIWEAEYKARRDDRIEPITDEQEAAARAEIERKRTA